MAVLVFFSLASAIVIAAVAWLLSRVPGSPDPFLRTAGHQSGVASMRMSLHALVVLVAGAVMTFAYLHYGFGREFVLGDGRAEVYGLAPRIVLDHPAVGGWIDLVAPFFHLPVARTAMLGFAVAAAGYFWYIERRRSEWARAADLEAALDDLLGAKAAGRTPAPSALATVAANTVRRADPPSLLFVLFVIFAVAVTEGPGILRALNAKVGMDGKVELSLRSNAQDGAGPPKAVAGGVDTSSFPGSTREPKLRNLVERIKRDRESICALLEAAFPASAATPGAAGGSGTADHLSPYCKISGLSDEALRQDAGLKELDDYEAAAKPRTQALVQCLVGLADDPSMRPMLRTVTQPLLDSYVRLMRAEAESPGETQLMHRPHEILAWMRALAALHDRAQPGSLPFDRATTTSTPPSRSCIETLDFSAALKSELAEAGLLTPAGGTVDAAAPNPALAYSSVCPNAAGGHRHALCSLLSLETRLPYGMLSLAAFADISGEPDEAVLILERWMARRYQPNAARLKLVDHWHYFIVANFRNNLLRSWRDWREGARSERDLTALHPLSTADALLERWAREFESRTVEDKDLKACRDPASHRLLVLTLIRHEERYRTLDMRLKLSGRVELNRAFAAGLPQQERAVLVGFEKLLPCLKANAAVQSPYFMRNGQPELLQASHLVLHAEYALALARFLNSAEGGSENWYVQDDSPRRLTEDARKKLLEARGILIGIRKQCAAGQSALCLDHGSLEPYMRARAIMFGTDDQVSQRLHSVENLLADLSFSIQAEQP